MPGTDERISHEKENLQPTACACHGQVEANAHLETASHEQGIADVAIMVIRQKVYDEKKDLYRREGGHIYRTGPATAQRSARVYYFKRPVV